VKREREGGSNSVVESQPSKLLVAGSIPVSRSTHITGRKIGSSGHLVIWSLDWTVECDQMTR
jgi:hypothetical protein